MSGARSRTTLLAVPFVAVLALAMGLRVGARDDFDAAIVTAAPAGKGQPALSWQVMTVREKQGVQETVALESVHVWARASGREARLDVATNADGIAEVSLPLGALGPGANVELRVTDAAGVSLAEGSTVLVAPPRPAAERHWVQPSKREGRVGLDVTLRGGRLAVGHPAEGWVRLTDQSNQRALAGATLTLTPEMGLSAATAGPSCETGWAKVELTPLAHVVGVTIDARWRVDEGTWYGALPVAAGALVAEVPTRAAEGPLEFDVVAPGSQSVAYVEVDDEVGRVYATALPLAGPGVPRAHVKTPPLSAGLHWVVTSGEPTGAETMSGATLALPVRVGGEAKPCDAADDSGLVPPGFPRWTALDGRIAARARGDAKHASGVMIGVGALVIAAVLETLLLLASARRTAQELAQLAQDADAPTLAPSRRRRATDVAVALLLLLLGLCLLASFVAWRS